MNREIKKAVEAIAKKQKFNVAADNANNDRLYFEVVAMIEDCKLRRYGRFRFWLILSDFTEKYKKHEVSILRLYSSYGKNFLDWLNAKEENSALEKEFDSEFTSILEDMEIERFSDTYKEFLS